MNIHKNARLTLMRRIQMVRDMTTCGVSPGEAGVIHGVSATTARKWLGRFLIEGESGLGDRSSRPNRSPRSIAPSCALAIVELRKRRLTQARIAQALGVSKSTVGRVLARAGLSRLADLEPVQPVQRYEHPAAGDLLHIDTKRLVRFANVGHRITGDRTRQSRGAGWEYLFVAVDDHARIGFTQIYPDERKASATQFLINAVAYYKMLGISIRRVLSDNGKCFRSNEFRDGCQRLRIKHLFTKPYTPRTNGKAERFIQSALREWAYAFTYTHSDERADTLEAWTHHYNWHRPHQGIGGIAPMSRLKKSENNLLTLHS
ncbi:MAG TPA: IS481 family transposase [Usitatibacter sp.]|nr:IS481 family transposase [Usitatibacter sp.]